MQRRYHFEIAPEYQGYTVSEYLKIHMLGFSPKIINKLFHHSLVRTERQVLEKHERIEAGTHIFIHIPKEQIDQFAKSFVPVEILADYEEFVIVNKQPGIPAIPEKWSHRAYLRKSLENHWQEKGYKECTPKVVLRMDKEAGGALLVARDDRIFDRLRQAVKESDVKYIALVAGIPEPEGKIELKIMQANNYSEKLEISDAGKPAVTCYKVIESFRDFALVELTVEQGKMSQLRVHMAGIGHPVAVDGMYGYRSALALSDIKKRYHKKGRVEKPLISRLTLHAANITFQPGKNKPEVSVDCPLPEDFQLILKKLRKYRN